MFFPENKTIFVHIPKTGGTSIEHEITTKFLKINAQNKALYMHENHTIRGKFNKFEFDTPKGHRHSFICEYDEFLNLNDYNSFTILREPTSQVYSLFKQIKDNHRLKNNLHNCPSLEDFIFGNCKHDLKFYDYYINQYKYTHINNELKVNYIFSYEKYHLVQDFVEKIYGIKVNRNLILMKTTPDEQVLSNEMKKEIKKCYPETFDFYYSYLNK